MKSFLKIFLSLLVICLSFSYSYAVDDLNIWNLNWEWQQAKNNNHLNSLSWEWFFKIWGTWGEKWILYLLFRIAKDIKNVFFAIASLYLIILIIKILFSNNTEEEVWKFKKWVIWTTIWIIIMQIAYTSTKVLYDRGVWQTTAFNFTQTIIQPFINLLELLASFFFIAIAIFAFYRIVTANLDEEKVKQGKISIFQAIVWFIVIKIADVIVTNTYWTINCNSNWGFLQITNQNCIEDPEVEWLMWMLISIINWINSFVWIVVVIMIIYAWFNILISAWDENKIKKAKNIILYIIIWMFILAANFALLTFFILPETQI